MKRTPTARFSGRMLVAGLVLALGIALAGCFESKYPLGPRSAALKLDPRLLGEWSLEQMDPDGQVNVSKLVVLNLQNEQYFVDWTETENDHFRAVAHLSDVNGVTFANLLPLTDSPQPQEAYTILRVEFDGTRLKLQNLDPDFFKERSFSSSEELRQIVAEHLEDEAMYRGEPFFGTKQ